MIGAIPAMFPNPPEQKVALINFIGSFCFTIGSYAAFLEAINLNLDVKLEWDAEIIVEKIWKIRFLGTRMGSVLSRMGNKFFLFGRIDLLLGRQLPDGSRNVRQITIIDLNIYRSNSNFLLEFDRLAFFKL